MKVECLMGDEQAAGRMRCREGRWLVRVSLPASPAWFLICSVSFFLSAIQDVFGLYDRPLTQLVLVGQRLRRFGVALRSGS